MTGNYQDMFHLHTDKTMHFVGEDARLGLQSVESSTLIGDLTHVRNGKIHPQIKEIAWSRS